MAFLSNFLEFWQLSFGLSVKSTHEIEWSKLTRWNGTQEFWEKSKVLVAKWTTNGFFLLADFISEQILWLDRLLIRFWQIYLYICIYIYHSVHWGINPPWKTPLSSFLPSVLLKARTKIWDNICQLSQNYERRFLFHLKALFVVKIFKFLFWLFGHAEKQFDLKDKVNFKFMTSRPG